MNKKTAKKWEKAIKQKTSVTQNTDAILIKTHERFKSEAEIIVPPKYKDLVKPGTILLIEPQNKQFHVYVQASASSLSDREDVEGQKRQISILKNIADLYGVVYGDNGMFRGEVRVVNEKHVVPSRELEYAEIVIRKTYFSRRDQYKVSEVLKQKVTHVHNRKILEFENTKVEVTNLMKNNKEILKTGFITKNTKLIFRSGCSKTAILVELSKETFDLNPTRQLYLERMIQFLIIYLHRNNFFNNKHRVEIILFARLFYPDFSTLTEAYQYLLKEATHNSEENKFEVNYAVSLQKDFRGRIYQDAYRKILWQSTSLSDFKKYFLEKVSEFLFTLNWDFNKNRHADFISRSINDEVNVELESEKYSSNTEAWKLKPFIHRMRCELSYSVDSNCFEAMCLVAEQYKHHYKFRALDETGNAIVILSAGMSEYTLDKTTYKMAKSYVFLTNISCMLVNINRRVEKVRANVYDPDKKLFQHENHIRKLENLAHWCVEEYVYQSPINEKIRFNSHKAGFQVKSHISPQDLKPFSEKQKSLFFREFGKGNRCFCQVSEDDGRSISFSEKKRTLKTSNALDPKNCKSTVSLKDFGKKEHFSLNENPERIDKQPLGCKKKQIEWISSFYMNNDAITIHEKFYEKSIFATKFYQPFNKDMASCTKEYGTFNSSLISELDTFDDDLEKIVIKKQSWFDLGCTANQLNNKFDRYLTQVSSISASRGQADRSVQSKFGSQQQGSQLASEDQQRKETYEVLEKTNKKLFYIQTKKQEKIIDFEKSSMEDTMDKTKHRMIDDVNELNYLRARKNSDYTGHSGNSEGFVVDSEDSKHEILRPKVNIFEETLKNKEYNIANIHKERKKKSLSHNKERLRGNYKEANIHYLFTYFNEQTVAKLNRFIRKEFNEALTQEQIRRNEAFEFEKQWKNICFPILTPIYTKYKEVFAEETIIPEAAQTGGERTLQDEVCKLLMQNYQLAEVSLNKNRFKLTKGHIIRTLEKNDNYITKGYIIDKEKQANLVPALFYRYLLYEEKDYRFCCKTIYFEDKNFYDKDKKDSVQSETKSLKQTLSKRPFRLLFLCDCVDDARESCISYNPNALQSSHPTKKSPIEDFKRLFKEKFQTDIYISERLLDGEDLTESFSNLSNSQKSFRGNSEHDFKLSKKKPTQPLILQKEIERKIVMNLEKKPQEKSAYSSLKGKTEEIRVRYDSEYSPSDLLKVIIEWDNCSSILVNEFVENLITIGRRSKFNSFLTTTEDVFSVEWNMNVVGEIIFSNELAVEMLEKNVKRNGEWFWDSMGFFMDFKGIAFIKFQKHKKLVLWKENNYEKKNRKPELYNKEYNKFFMVSAVFDFLGEMIENSIKRSKVIELQSFKQVKSNTSI